MLRIHKCLLLAILLLAQPVFSETVLQLKNGDRITGSVVSETTNQVVLSTSWSREMVVPVSLIDKRTESAPLNGMTNGPSIRAGGTPVVVPPNPPIRPKPSKQWDFDLKVGGNVQHNQRSSEFYSGAVKIEYKGLRFHHTAETTADYGGTDGVLSANKMHGGLRSEYSITKSRQTYFYNSVDAGYDSVRNIDLSYEESAGVGYKFYERTNFVFGSDVGANYQREFFKEGTQKDFVSLRFGENMAWKITDWVSWDQKVDFYPRMSDIGDFRVKFETSVSYKLNTAGSVYLNFAVSDTYDTSPAKDVTPNDFQVRSSIGVKF